MADLLTTEPKAGDSKNNLLFKWVEEVCGPGVAKIADSDNILLSKILRCTIAGGGGGSSGLVTADFVADVFSGETPLAVVFSNLSTGSSLSYLWNFGDGSTSTETNPTHTFNVVGNYTITLTATGPEGADIEEKVAYITATSDAIIDVRSDLGVIESAGVVSEWQDQSGHIQHATQGVENLKPLLVPAQLNGFSAIRFDGVNAHKDALNTAAFSVRTELTYMVVLRAPILGQHGIFRTLDFPDYELHRDGANRWTVTYTGFFNGPVGAGTSAQLLTGTWSSSGAATLRKNGVDHASGPIGAGSFTRFSLGATTITDGGVAADMFAFKAWGRLLTTAERNTQEAFLMAKYAL